MNSKFKKPWVPMESPRVIEPPKRCVLCVAVSTDTHGVLGIGSEIDQSMFRYGTETLSSLVRRGLAEWI